MTDPFPYPVSKPSFYLLFKFLFLFLSRNLGFRVIIISSLFFIASFIHFQVFLGHSGAPDIEGNELPRLVYVSREKRPGYQHHKKAGAKNALVRVSAILTNAPYILNLDCDHYVNNSKVVREAMCFMMDPQIGRDVCYIQFPQRFDGIDCNDRYANRNTLKLAGL